MELNYSNNLKDIREQRGINKARMARELDISRKCILQIERGEQSVSLYLAYKICTYFGLQLQEVFPYVEEKPPTGAPVDYMVEVTK